MSSCLASAGKRDDQNTILEYLRGMEQRQKIVTHECATTAGSDTVEKINGRLNTVQASVDSIGGQVAAQMMSLINTVDLTVRASVQKLDVGSIATTVSACVRQCHLKEAISLLDDLAFDRISSLLLGVEKETVKVKSGPAVGPVADTLGVWVRV